MKRRRERRRRRRRERRGEEREKGANSVPASRGKAEGQ